MENNSIKINGINIDNLHDCNIEIPKNKIVTFTGVSGSGKTSIAKDVLYNSVIKAYLANYEVNFRDTFRFKNSSVDNFSELPMTIYVANDIHFVNAKKNIMEYLDIHNQIFFLIKQYCYVANDNNERINRLSCDDLINDILQHNNSENHDVKLIFTCRIKQSCVKNLVEKGFNRFYVDGEIKAISNDIIDQYETFDIVIDRFLISNLQNNQTRIEKYIQFCTNNGGLAYIYSLNNAEPIVFYAISNNNCINIDKFIRKTCSTCHFKGYIYDIDYSKIFNKDDSVKTCLSILWAHDQYKQWLQLLLKTDLPIDKSYYDLSKEDQDKLINGYEKYKGVNAFFEYIEQCNNDAYIDYLFNKYRNKKICPDCCGTIYNGSLKKLFIDNISVMDIITMSFNDFHSFLLTLKPTKSTQYIINYIIENVECIKKLNLGYLKISTRISLLSKTESYRLYLASISLNKFSDLLYILDYPTRYLDNENCKIFIDFVNELKAQYNSIIIIDNHPNIIQKSDYLIEFDVNRNVKIKCFENPLTYVDKKTSIYELNNLVVHSDSLIIKGLKYYSFGKEKIIDLNIPIGNTSLLKGTNGSGKTSILNNVYCIFNIYKSKYLDNFYKECLYNNSNILNVCYLKTTDYFNKQCNIAQYLKVDQYLLKMFIREMKKYYSLSKNIVDNLGICPTCKGTGYVNIEFNGLFNEKIQCNDCQGQCYDNEILALLYNDKTILEILNLKISEAQNFFVDNTFLSTIFMNLNNLNLGHLSLNETVGNLSFIELYKLKLAQIFCDDKMKYKSLILIDGFINSFNSKDQKQIIDFLNIYREDNTFLICDYTPNLKVDNIINI